MKRVFNLCLVMCMLVALIQNIIIYGDEISATTFQYLRNATANPYDNWGFAKYFDGSNSLLTTYNANANQSSNVSLLSTTVDNLSLDNLINWNFEGGNASPFTVASSNLENVDVSKLVDSKLVDPNDRITPLQKEGTYYLTTLLIGEANQVELKSPYIVLEDTTITLKIGGGTDPNIFFGVYDPYGNLLKKVQRNGDGHVFQDVTVNLADVASIGDVVYFKVVDNKVGTGWAFITVDDIKLHGHIYEESVQDIVWSFENGRISPFRLFSGTLACPISTWNYDRNNYILTPQKLTPINKDGTYFFTTLQTQNVDIGVDKYSEAQQGDIRSPLFTLASYDVSFKIGGGNSVSTYVALCRANGDEIARAQGPNSHVFKQVIWNQTQLGSIILNEDKVYIKVVDAKNVAGWGFVTFDDFRARGTIKYSQVSEASVEALIGWSKSRIEKLKLIPLDLEKTYTNYSSTAIITKLNGAIAEFNTLVETVTEISDPKILEFDAKLDALEKEVIMTHPLLKDTKIAFVTRPQYKKDHHNTHTMFPETPGEVNTGSYTPGGAVKVMDFSNNATVTELLPFTAEGSYRDFELSYDANKFLISYRTKKDGSYKIWEHTLGDDKKSVISSKQLTSMRNAEDMDPLYLPSGNIVFSSTRDPKYVMCNQHISANIYRMEADGANIVKITNSTLFERPTDVLPNGRILYDRWEYNDRDFGSAQGLWTVGEDGTQQVTYYGNNSPTGATIDAKAISGTQTVIATLTSTHDKPWGGLAIIDRRFGVDGYAPVLRTWPETVKSNIKNTGIGNNIDAYLGLTIKYEDPQPLSDKYFLASRQINTTSEKMGIYLLDLNGNEILLYEDNNATMGAYDATVIKPRDKEMAVQSRRDYNNGVGQFFVQNVYEGTQMKGVNPGSVKTLRVIQSMDKNYHSPSKWGGEGQQNPGVNWHNFEVKRVLGDVPVEADGSAYFEVPQDKFVYFQLLDENGVLIQSMRSATLVQSGEKTGCVGCHDDRRKTPISNTTSKTPMALEKSFSVKDGVGVNTPNKLKSYNETKNVNFLTDVQPIFTTNCISCHGYESPQADLTLVPDKAVIFNAAYVDLWRTRDNKPSTIRFRNMLGVAGAAQTEFIPAYGWGSYSSSPLINKIFNDEGHKNRLTAEEKKKIAEWVACNAPYYGDYATNYGTSSGGRSPLTDAELNTIPGGLGWVFSWAEKSATPIYFDNPQKSPILKRWAVGSAEYNTVLALIEKGKRRLDNTPDVDMPGYTRGVVDAWRFDKVQLRNAIEAANRSAIKNNLKRYDWDNTKENGLQPDPDAAFTNRSDYPVFSIQ